MNMLLNLNASSFEVNIVIDPTTFKFRGMVEGYDYDSSKSFCSVSFRLPSNADVDTIVEQIKETFQLNRKYAKVEDYIDVRKEFESYETDLRPLITIKFKEGSKGMTNPPAFSFTSIESL